MHVLYEEYACIWCPVLCHVPVCLCALHMRVEHAEQVSEVVSCWFSGSLNNNTWLVKALQYVFKNSFLFSSWSLCSALVSALDFAKYVHCKGSAVLSCSSSIAKKRCPPNSVLHWLPCVMCDTRVPDRKGKLTFRAWSQIDIPKCDQNVCMYICTHAHTHISRIDSSFRAWVFRAWVSRA